MESEKSFNFDDFFWAYDIFHKMGVPDEQLTLILGPTAFPGVVAEVAQKSAVVHGVGSIKWELDSSCTGWYIKDQNGNGIGFHGKK